MVHVILVMCVLILITDPIMNWTARRKGGRRWDVWMASSTQWTRVWANSGRRWRTGKWESHFLGRLIRGLRAPKERGVWNPKECRGIKKVCPFFLLENSRPLSPWGPLDLLSTCLGNDSLISLSFTISQSLLKLMSVESMMPSKHILCPPSF